MEQELNQSTSEDLSSGNYAQSSPSASTELLPISDLIRMSFSIYKNKFWKLIGILFIPFILLIPLLAVLIVVFIGKDLFAGGFSPMLIFSNLPSLEIIGLIMAVVTISLFFLVQTGMIILVGGGNDMQMSAFGAFMKARKYVWKIIVIDISVSLFVFLWSLLFIIPGIIMSIFYSLARWSFFYEGFTGTATLKRSKELIKGHWWGVFLRSIILPFALQVGISIVFLVVGGGFLLLPFKIILSYMLVPFFMILSSLVYQDLVKIKGPSAIVNKKGSSLGVVVFVIIIIASGALSQIVIRSMNASRLHAQDAMMISNAKMAETSVQLYFVEHNSYPSSNYINAASRGVNYKATATGYEICFYLQGENSGYKKGKNCLRGK